MREELKAREVMEEENLEDEGGEVDFMLVQLSKPYRFEGNEIRDV